MSSVELTSDQEDKEPKRKTRASRIIKPDIDEFDWEAHKIDSAWKGIVQKILSNDKRINEWLHELRTAGMLQKDMAKLFGVSRSNISQRLKGELGVLDVAYVEKQRRKKVLQEKREQWTNLPYSDYLGKLLELHGVQKTSAQRIMDLYTEFTITYENPQNFFDLLRAQKVPSAKAKLITGQFFHIL